MSTDPQYPPGAMQQPPSAEEDELSEDATHAAKRQYKHKYYHCCLKNKFTGNLCPATCFRSGNIQRHLRLDIHFGPNYKDFGRGGKLPDGVVPCGGSYAACEVCRIVKGPEKPEDQQAISQVKETGKSQIATGTKGGT